MAKNHADLSAVLLAKHCEHRCLACAKRTLKVAPHDDRDGSVVGPDLVTRQAQADAIRGPRIELGLDVARALSIGGELALSDQLLVRRLRLRRSRKLLVDGVSVHLERMRTVDRPAVDEERRCPSDAKS